MLQKCTESENCWLHHAQHLHKMNNDANTICIVLKCCMSLVIWQVIVHATILHCLLFIVHWPHFIVHSFHNIVQPDVQHVVHNVNCVIVHNYEQFAPTLTSHHLPVSVRPTYGLQHAKISLLPKHEFYHEFYHWKRTKLQALI